MKLLACLVCGPQKQRENGAPGLPMRTSPLQGKMRTTLLACQDMDATISDAKGGQGTRLANRDRNMLEPTGKERMMLPAC